MYLLDLLPRKESSNYFFSVMGKRTTSVTVKMSAEDHDLLQKAAEKLWPRAILTKSSIVLGLARMTAETVLDNKLSRKARKEL